jgi:hypothetical protein
VERLISKDNAQNRTGKEQLLHSNAEWFNSEGDRIALQGRVADSDETTGQSLRTVDETRLELERGTHHLLAVQRDAQQQIADLDLSRTFEDSVRLQVLAGPHGRA